MKRSLKTFIGIGILTMLAGEFQINVLVLKKGFSAFLFSVGLYIVLLLVAFTIGKVLEKIFSTKHVDIVYYILGGLFGLVLEWVVFGNSLMNNPLANQAGMFAWWGAVFLLPRIWTTREDEYREAITTSKRRALIVLLLYSFISTVVVALLPLEPSYLRPALVGLLMAVVYIILNFQFIPYLSRHGVSKKALRVFCAVLLIAGITQFLGQ